MGENGIIYDWEDGELDQIQVMKPDDYNNLTFYENGTYGINDNVQLEQVYPCLLYTSYQIQNLDKEQGIMGRLTAERDRLEARKEELKLENARTRADMDQKEAAGTTVFALKACYMVLDSGRKQLEALEDDLSAIAGKIERQRQVVLAASQEVKKLEKLKENQLQEYRRNEAKEQQEIIAEHVAEAFVRNCDSI